MYYETKMAVLPEIFGTSEIRLGAASLNVSESLPYWHYYVVND
jgi:hypothetical protein|tara:strand:+ start:554 stop:682 length:129 start_codon:yes stop_codon:yes gene_type:complete